MVYTSTICNNSALVPIWAGWPFIEWFNHWTKTFPRLCVIELQSHSDQKTLKPVIPTFLFLVPLETNFDSLASLSVQNNIAILLIFCISLQDPWKDKKSTPKTEPSGQLTAWNLRYVSSSSIV